MGTTPPGFEAIFFEFGAFIAMTSVVAVHFATRKERGASAGIALMQYMALAKILLFGFTMVITPHPLTALGWTAGGYIFGVEMTRLMGMIVPKVRKRRQDGLRKREAAKR